LATTVLEQFLQDTLAGLLECDPAALSITDEFGEQGVDSLIGLRLARKIQDFTGQEIELEWLFDYPSIGTLAAFLIRQQATAAAAACAPSAV
jgi:acyl carrier protein